MFPLVIALLVAAFVGGFVVAQIPMFVGSFTKFVTAIKTAETNVLTEVAAIKAEVAKLTGGKL